VCQVVARALHPHAAVRTARSRVPTPGMNRDRAEEGEKNVVVSAWSRCEPAWRRTSARRCEKGQP
jgi:hypothetical protein